MAEQGGLRRPSTWRVICVSLATAAAVLWFWSGWTWWVLVPLVGGLIVARLLIGLFPPHWRDWASGLALAVIAALVVVWLLRFTPPVALGVAVGAGGIVCVAQLRKTMPRWMQGTALGLSTALALTCGLVAWLSWRADEQQRQAAEQTEREYRVAELRPDRPLAALHLVVKAIHENTPELVCFIFTPEAEHEFAEAVDADTCPAAINTLHDKITGKGYGNATADLEDVTYETKTRPATVSGCHMYIVDGPLEHSDPPGPLLGSFRLERDPRFPTSGYLITRYTPCGEADPDTPTSPASPLVLPSYPPSFAGILTRAIAANDPDVCEYFTETGATQLAETTGTDSCPDAIEILAAQVADPTAYANPSGVTVTTTNNTEVQACALIWTRWNEGPIAAGPQLGYLTLTQPEPSAPGFLINGVRPC